MRAQRWMPFENANATGPARRRGKRGRTDMHGLVGCVVEVGHWRRGRDETDPLQWMAEYKARVGAVLQPTSDEWQDAPRLLVVKLATGELRAVNIDHVIVPEFRSE